MGKINAVLLALALTGVLDKPPDIPPRMVPRGATYSLSSPSGTLLVQAPAPKPSPSPAPITIPDSIPDQKPRPSAEPTPPPTPTPAAPAQSPAIIVPTTIPQYPLIRLTLAGGPIDDVDWEMLFTPNLTLTVDYVKTNVTANGATTFGCVFTGPPGPYRITAWITAGGTISHATVSLTIPAPPAPPPNPTPPNPVTAKFWAVAVFDQSTLFDLPPGKQNVYSSLTLPSAVAGMGGYWKRFDTSNPDISATGPPWAAAAIKAGLPALVVVDSNGGILLAQPLPDDEAGVLAAVKGVVPEKRPTAKISEVEP